MALQIGRLIFPKKLGNRFPTKLDTLRAFVYEKQKHPHLRKTESSNFHIADVLVKKIERIYARAGLATLRKDIIAGKVIKAYKSRLTLLKFSRSQRYTDVFLKKKLQFESEMGEILQVVDTRNKKQNESHKQNNLITDIDLSDDNESIILNSDNESDSDYEPPNNITCFAKREVDLTEIVETQSRFSYSDRGTAAIVNATLKAFQIPVIIDKSKLQRAQKRTFREMNETDVTLREFGGGLYYDSRKDLTINHSKKLDENGKFKFYRTVCRQEHYSLVSQPNGLFLGFLNAEDSTADVGSTVILKFIRDNNMSNEVDVLGSDGTNTNVGADGGINHYIELALGRPLQWFVCMLHLNELPLKNLIVKLDGKTTGANSFAGPIGKALENICKPPIVNFNRFTGSQKLVELPVAVYKKLSSDQKYLYRIVNALITGEFSESLKQLKVGRLCHSRWITTASRICLLYASTENPCETLQTFTSYIVDVYAPTWFEIKTNELAINGPKNLFFLIKKTNLILNETAKAMVRKCIQRNAFFAHSENILLAQLASKKKSIRNDGVRKIFEIRSRKDNTGIRKFVVPKINFDAQKWTEILIWESSKMTEPPLTLKMTESELTSVIKTPLKVPQFKCHTQMVERAVKEVTRVSAKAIDHEKQQSLVKATLISRAKYPKFDSKKDHVIQTHSNILPKI